MIQGFDEMLANSGTIELRHQEVISSSLWMMMIGLMMII
jgi:hypothetical protein